MKIGVLALQGGVIEHINHLKALNCEAIEVKKAEELDDLDGIILPGGESTTMGKLLIRTGILNKLRDKILNGFPVWGTCAGMILLAKNIENDETRHLNVMDITVKRNAYGSQLDSFETNKVITEVSPQEIPLIFIRAPYITHVNDSVTIMCKVGENIVAAIQANMLVTSFHPELSKILEFHKYFIGFCKKIKK